MRMRERMSRFIGQSLLGIGFMLHSVKTVVRAMLTMLKKSVLWVFVVIVVVGLFLLFPVILRLFWNDMAPVFGIDIQLSLWQTIKAMWLVAFISGIVKGFNFKYNGKKE